VRLHTSTDDVIKCEAPHINKDVIKCEAPHINKDDSPMPVLKMLFTEIFHLLVEQTNVHYQQHLDSRRLPDITLPDMMTFIALVLQIGHA